MRTVFLVTLAACGNSSSATMCEPFKELNLPSITRIDRCNSNDLTGETTASPEQFAAAWKAKGYEVGRDAQEPKYTNDWMYFRRGKDTFMMSSKFEGSEARKNPFFYIRRDEPRKWVPEAQWVALQNFSTEHAKLAESLRAAGELLASHPKAPRQCPAFEDPHLENTPALIVNLDSSDVSATEVAHHSRGPELYSSQEQTYEPLELRLARVTEQDSIKARRIVPFMRVTRYDGPHVPTSANITGTFEPGSATFEIGVIDLVDKKLLCRSKGKAESSATIEATTTTYYRPDGGIESTHVGADADADLAKNMHVAAFAELSKMSPAFSPIPRPKPATK